MTSAATEYAVRYTDLSGGRVLAYNPAMADPADRADADARARCLRCWQEDRSLPADATLMRRAPGRAWEVDPTWAAEIAVWNARRARPWRSGGCPEQPLRRTPERTS